MVRLVALIAKSLVTYTILITLLSKYLQSDLLVLLVGELVIVKKLDFLFYGIKIKKHITLSAHKFATNILIERESDKLKNQFENSSYKFHKSTFSF